MTHGWVVAVLCEMVMADCDQSDFGQPSLAKPTLASVSVFVVWPTLAKTDLAKTDFGQTDFDLCLCVFVCVFCVILCVCVCCVCLCVLVWRGCWFHGIRVGFHVWVLVWTALPGTILPLDRPSQDRPSQDRPSQDRPKFRSSFSLSPPQNWFFSSLSGCLLVEFWWCLKRRGGQMCTLGLSGCRVKPRRLRGPTLQGTKLRVPVRDTRLNCGLLARDGWVGRSGDVQMRGEFFFNPCFRQGSVNIPRLWQKMARSSWQCGGGDMEKNGFL